MSSERVVQTGAVPSNNIKPFPDGSNSIYTAGVVTQQNQAKLQTSLAQNGGIRRRIKGGSAPVIVVPPAPSYAPDQAATNANNMQLAKLANETQSQAVLDKTVNGNQADAATISAKQNAIYTGKGGSKRKRASNKRGCYWPKWGCLSGGKRRTKKCKCKRRKSRKHRH